MRSLSKNTTALLATLAVIGCGGSSDGGAQGTGGPTNGAPVSDAGPDRDASFGFRVSLDGESSSDPEGEALTWTWRQVRGPDVTDGRGTLDGPTPSFVAPETVATLVFDLRVSDGSTESEPDTVTVRVFEDQLAAFFVDGDAGDDELGNGSREAPFASIAKALCEVTESRQDIYVMSRANGARYDETTDPCPGEPARSADRILAVPTGTSLYGGFDADWSRDVEGNRAGVDLLHHGVQFEAVDQSARLSGFDLSAADSPEPEESVFVVRAIGGAASLAITDNVMTAGNVAAGGALAPGTSYGLLLGWLDQIDVRRNVIIAGRGGSATAVGNVFNSAAAAGGDAIGTSRGDGKGPEDYDGGGGGAPGYQGGENGARGDRGEGPGGIGGCGGGQGSGGANCVGEQQSGDNGRRGADGGPGSGGSLGESGTGHGSVNAWVEGTTAFAAYVPGNGRSGNRGTAGRGGGGGGGGEANTGVNGGIGGAGGGGGAGGRGGPGGMGGGASIGILVVGVVEAAIHDNQVTADAGGDGGSGGAGQLGGGGGTGGAGDDGNTGAFGITGGHGGNGGNGGPGGPGGHGGAGGGGASFGLLVGANTAPAVSGNTILAGAGGLGGEGAGGLGGAGGYSYAVYDETPDDGAVPALTDNALEAGLPGLGGPSTTGDSGDAGLAGPRNF